MDGFISDDEKSISYKKTVDYEWQPGYTGESVSPARVSDGTNGNINDSRRKTLRCSS